MREPFSSVINFATELPYIKLNRYDLSLTGKGVHLISLIFSRATADASWLTFRPSKFIDDIMEDSVLVTWYLFTSPIEPILKTLPLSSPKPPATRTLNSLDISVLNWLSSIPSIYLAAITTLLRASSLANGRRPSEFSPL